MVLLECNKKGDKMKEVKTIEEYILREIERKEQIINELENERNSDNQYILKLEKKIEEYKEAIQIIDLREDIFSSGIRINCETRITKDDEDYMWLKEILDIKEGTDYRD